MGKDRVSGSLQLVPLTTRRMKKMSGGWTVNRSALNRVHHPLTVI